MISIVGISIIALIQAMIETLKDKFFSSVFRNLNKQFWNPDISWTNKYVMNNPKLGRKKLFWKINVPVQISDAFHLFKTIQIIILAYITTNTLLMFCIAGLTYNLVFGILYHIFRRDSIEVIRDNYPIIELFRKRIRE